MKGLIVFLEKATVARQVMRIRICRGAPLINHLLFADNNILFCKVERRKQEYPKPTGTI